MGCRRIRRRWLRLNFHREMRCRERMSCLKIYRCRPTEFQAGAAVSAAESGGVSARDAAAARFRAALSGDARRGAGRRWTDRHGAAGSRLGERITRGGRRCGRSVACAAWRRIIALPDGSYNVLVLGLRRIVIVRELPADKSFREAQVELKTTIIRHRRRGGPDVAGPTAGSVQAGAAENSRSPGTVRPASGQQHSAGHADRHRGLYAGHRPGFQGADAARRRASTAAPRELLEHLARLRRPLSRRSSA